MESDPWTIDRQLLSLETAEAWRGTRHRNRIAIRGVGIDCIRFVVEILKGAGLVDDQPLPSYPIGWGLAEDHNRIVDALAAVLDVQRIAPEAWVPQWGDILVFRVGRQSNHCGILLGGQVWHVANGNPVGTIEISQVRNATQNDFQEIVRLRRPGWTVSPGSVNLRQV